MRPWIVALLIALVAGGTAGTWLLTRGTPQPSASASIENATYVGSRACAGCHAKEHAAWQG